MTREALGDDLALANAFFNASCGVLLLLGRYAIAKKRPRTHRAFMISAFCVSCIFLTSYLTRVWLTGTHRDPHVGWLHWTYFAILGTHMILAISVVPMVLASLRFALRGELARHKKIARVTFPIWLYVSVTGVVVYLILYRVPA